MKKPKKSIGLLVILFFIFFSCSQNSSITNNGINNTKTLTNINLEEKIIIPAGFSKSYEIKKEEDLSYAGINRKQLRIVVPSQLDKSQIENNIGHLVLEYQKRNHPDGLSILVYEKGDNIESAYSVAMGEFAPYGKWGSIGKNIPLELYELNIQYRDTYFQPKEKTLRIGAEVTLFNEKEWSAAKQKVVPASSVKLSNSKSERTKEKIIGKVPNNSKATILDIYQVKMPEGTDLIRYKIEVKYNNNNFQGWIHNGDIKK